MKAAFAKNPKKNSFPVNENYVVLVTTLLHAAAY